jgi:transposase
MRPSQRSLFMSMGRRQKYQSPLWIAHDDLVPGPGHRFYEKLNELLGEADFDRRAEALCAPYYEAADVPGRKSVAPGIYFRMHLVGFFEGLESERGLEWRFADSLSLRRFLGLPLTQRVPDHSTLSRTRQRLPLEVHQAVFALILGIVEAKGLLKGHVLGGDATYLRADASMKAIVRRDTKESYTEFVTRLATEAGVVNPTAEDGRRLDRKRKGKKTSNREWVSRTDPDARIAKLKDGRTRLAYKPEHVVDLETGALVAAVLHPADVADPASVETSLTEAEANLQTAQGGDTAAKPEDPAPAEEENPPARNARPRRKVVADKGYHKGTLLWRLKSQRYRTYIPERRQAGRRRWTDKGGTPTAVAFHQNRARGARPLGKRYHRWRAERVERTFAHVCETGGARRTRLRGRANVAKCYLLQAAGANLALVMRALYGLGTPRGWAGRAQAACWALIGFASILLPWWTAHRRSPFGGLRPGTAWGPPSAELPAWPLALHAGG